MRRMGKDQKATEVFGSLLLVWLSTAHSLQSPLQTPRDVQTSPEAPHPHSKSNLLPRASSSQVLDSLGNFHGTCTLLLKNDVSKKRKKKKRQICRNKAYFYLPKSQARRERTPSMPEMWLSLRTRSIISHLKLTHLEAICKCSSICRIFLGEECFILSTPGATHRGPAQTTQVRTQDS